MVTQSNSVKPLTVGIPPFRPPSPSPSESRLPESGTFDLAAVDVMKKQRFELSIADEAVVHILEKINRTLAGIPRQVEYSLHRGDGQMVIRIVNSETKEVLKEIPPEKILDMLDKFREMNQPSGIIIDEKR